MSAKKDEAKNKGEAVEAKEEKKAKAAAKKPAEKAEKAEEPKAGKAEEPKAGKAEEPKARKAEEPKAGKAEKKETKAKAAGSVTIDKVVEMVETMTVLELADLVKTLEERFDVSAAAPMAIMPGMAAGAAGAAEEAEEQTEFDVILKDFGGQKIQVIKVVRAITGLGLIEAKKLVEDAPKPIKEAINKEEAEDIKKKVEEVGATAEIK